MAKLLTYGGQIIDPTTDIYIYRDTYTVEFKSGPRFGGFVLKTGRLIFSVCLKSQIVPIGPKRVFSQNCQDAKNELFKKKMAFFLCFPFHVEVWNGENPVFSCTLSVLAKTWAKTAKTRKTIK